MSEKLPIEWNKSKLGERGGGERFVYKARGFHHRRTRYQMNNAVSFFSHIHYLETSSTEHRDEPSGKVSVFVKLFFFSNNVVKYGNWMENIRYVFFFFFNNEK